MAAAKGRKLAANVVLDGQAYSAGEVPPKDVADRITNPKAWGDDPKAVAASGSGSDGSGAGSDGSGSGSGSDPDGPPPKGGAGSGVDAWAKYAETNKVEVPQGANREDIIGLLEKAGVATETAPPE